MKEPANNVVLNIVLVVIQQDSLMFVLFVKQGIAFQALNVNLALKTAKFVLILKVAALAKLDFS